MVSACRDSAAYRNSQHLTQRAQDQASQHRSQGGAHEAPPPAEELLATDGCQERDEAHGRRSHTHAHTGSTK